MKRIYCISSIFVLLLASVPMMAQESFFEICKTGTPAQITKALKKGATVKVNEYGITPLMWVAQYNPNPEAINVLIKNGASVNEVDSTGTTPLMYAAMNNTPEVIMALLNAGADAKLKNSDGKTAYDIAEYNDNVKRTPVYQALKDAQDK